MKIRKLFSFFALFLFYGCADTGSYLMPEATEVANAPWPTYEDAQKAYDKITPYQTNLEGLKKIGFDPVKVSNVRLLDVLTVRNMFLVSPTVKQEDLPMGIQDCLSSEKCKGYEFPFTSVSKKGVGNIFLRFMRFKQKELTTGSSVIFTIFLKEEIVVFKLDPKGTSIINKLETKTNPLGPLQEPLSFFNLRDYIPLINK